MYALIAIASLIFVTPFVIPILVYFGFLAIETFCDATAWCRLADFMQTGQ